MATKLGIFNDALLLLGELKLAGLTENREARHVLDDSWTGRVQYCLSKGFWNFAMRTVEIAASDSVDPLFGMTYAFEKPDDWVRTYRVADNERFEPQLTQFEDRSSNWFADVNPLYVEFISNDNTWGFDLGRWPQSFSDAVSASLAEENCFRITGSDSRLDRIKKAFKDALSTARSEDAMNEPPGQFPTNSWVRSRGDSFLTRDRWDRRSP